MKKILIILAALLTSNVAAQEFTPPTDWALNSINGPAKTATYTLVSDQETQQIYTINFNKKGFQNTITSIFPDEYTTVALFMPYIGQRRTMTTGMGEDQKSALKKIQDQASRITTIPYEEWITNNTLKRDMIHQKNILTINDQFQTISNDIINNQDEVEISYNIKYLSSEDEINNITPQPNTIYIIFLEWDEHQSWTQQKQIFFNNDNPTQQEISIITRSIKYYQ